MSSLPSSEQIAAIARQLLSERYGEDVIFNDVAELTGSSSSVVLRAKVAPTAVLQQRSIVIKYGPASGDPLDDAALIREVVSYQFTTALPEDVRPGPVLLAYDIDHRILVISDVGEADTFDHLLDIEDSSARVALLRTLGQAVGRMHAGTAQREQNFDILLSRMLQRYPDTRELHELRDASLLGAIDVGIDLLKASQVEISPTVVTLAQQAKRRLSSGQHRAFTPFDLSPDNIIYADRTGAERSAVERVKFLDYEWAGFRDATFDVACVIAGFPQYLFSRTLNAEESDAFIRSWADAVRGLWPNVDNRERLNARIITALLGWAFASVSYLYYGSMSQLVNQMSSSSQVQSGQAGDIPSAQAEALATATYALDDVDYDILIGGSLDSVLNEGGDARKDLHETFAAIVTFARRCAEEPAGDDVVLHGQFLEVADFAAVVCARLEQLRS